MSDPTPLAVREGAFIDCVLMALRCDRDAWADWELIKEIEGYAHRLLPERLKDET